MAKGKGGRPPVYPPDVRQRALDLFAAEDGGLPRAHAETGIPKPTIRRWAKDAGIEPGEVTRANRLRTEAAAAAAKAENARRLEAAREALIPKLLSRAHTALDLEGEILDVARDTFRQARERNNLTTEEATRLLMRVELAAGGLSLRDVVGARTRAIYDLRALSGERPESGSRGDGAGGNDGSGPAGGVNVVFLTPPPDPRRKPTVIDLPPVTPARRAISAGDDDD